MAATFSRKLDVLKSKTYIDSNDFYSFVKNLTTLAKLTAEGEKLSQYVHVVKKWIGDFQIIFRKNKLNEEAKKCMNQLCSIVTEVYIKLLLSLHQFDPNYTQEFYCNWKEILAFMTPLKRAKSFVRHIDKFKIVMIHLRTAEHRCKQLSILKVLNSYTERVSLGELAKFKEHVAGEDVELVVHFIQSRQQSSTINDHDFLHYVSSNSDCISSFKPTKIFCEKLKTEFSTLEHQIWIDFNLKDMSIMFVTLSLHNHANQCLGIVSTPKLRENIVDGEYVINITGHWSFAANENVDQQRICVSIFFPIHIRNIILESQVTNVFKIKSNKLASYGKLSSKDYRLKYYSYGRDNRYTSFAQTSSLCEDSISEVPYKRLRRDNSDESSILLLQSDVSAYERTKVSHKLPQRQYGKEIVSRNEWQSQHKKNLSTENNTDVDRGVENNNALIVKLSKSSTCHEDTTKRSISTTSTLTQHDTNFSAPVQCFDDNHDFHKENSTIEIRLENDYEKIKNTQKITILSVESVLDASMPSNSSKNNKLSVGPIAGIEWDCCSSVMSASKNVCVNEGYEEKQFESKTDLIGSGDECDKLLMQRSYEDFDEQSLLTISNHELTTSRKPERFYIQKEMNSILVRDAVNANNDMIQENEEEYSGNKFKSTNIKVKDHYQVGEEWNELFMKNSNQNFDESKLIEQQLLTTSASETLVLNELIKSPLSEQSSLRKSLNGIVVENSIYKVVHESVYSNVSEVASMCDADDAKRMAVEKSQVNGDKNSLNRVFKDCQVSRTPTDVSDNKYQQVTVDNYERRFFKNKFRDIVSEGVEYQFPNDEELQKMTIFYINNSGLDYLKSTSFKKLKPAQKIIKEQQLRTICKMMERGLETLHRNDVMKSLEDPYTWKGGKSTLCKVFNEKVSFGIPELGREKLIESEKQSVTNQRRIRNISLFNSIYKCPTSTSKLVKRLKKNGIVGTKKTSKLKADSTSSRNNKMSMNIKLVQNQSDASSLLSKPPIYAQFKLIVKNSAEPCRSCDDPMTDPARQMYNNEGLSINEDLPVNEKLPNSTIDSEKNSGSSVSPIFAKTKNSDIICGRFGKCIKLTSSDCFSIRSN